MSRLARKGLLNRKYTPHIYKRAAKRRLLFLCPAYAKNKYMRKMLLSQK
jgi:hypothetical protein